MLRALLALVVVVVAIVAQCGLPVHGFQDDLVRVSRPWPPLAGAPTNGSDTYVLSPWNFLFDDISSLPSDVPSAILMYRSYVFPPTQVAKMAARRQRKAQQHQQHQQHNNQHNSQQQTQTRQRPLKELASLIIQAADPVIRVWSRSTDESYTLIVPVEGPATLTANTYVGVLRGLETLSQLVVYSMFDGEQQFVLQGVPWNITESPRFEHRGTLVDVARTFQPISVLERTVDALMSSKMNVLHIHLSDSHSFPMELLTYPEVTSNGAYSEDQVYSQDDLRQLVKYALQRGVRIIPEIDTPGHARAMALSSTFVDSLACGFVDGADWSKYCAEPPCGQLDPTSDGSYTLLTGIFKDIASVFPDQFIHLGFDEINFACWQSDPNIQTYMQTHNKTVEQLLLDFYNKEQAILQQVAPGRMSMFWEEAGKQTPPMTVDANKIIQLWSDKTALHTVLTNTEADVLVCWASNVYLDCGYGNIFGDDSWCDPYKTWLEMYTTDPLAGLTKQTDIDRVRGGESAMWSELTGPGDIMNKMWPRASAYGARLWNYDNVVSVMESQLAMEAHSQRLRLRGVAATQVAVQFCTINPGMCY